MVGAVNRVTFDYSPIDRVDSVSSISAGNSYNAGTYDFQNTVSRVGSTPSTGGSTGDNEYDVNFDDDPYANEDSQPRPLQFA